LSLSAHVWQVDLRLRASRFFLSLIFLLHCAALMALLQTALTSAWCWPLAVLLAASCALACRQERKATGMVLCEQVEGWWLEAAQRQSHATLQRSQVWRYLVVLDFLCKGEDKVWRQRVVIFPDTVSADSFRRLRVRLRYGMRQPYCDPKTASKTIGTVSVF
jgi:hypothetical protein